MQEHYILVKAILNTGLNLHISTAIPAALLFVNTRRNSRGLLRNQQIENGGVNMEELIKALRRFDSLETVIAELEHFDREDTIDDLTEYLNDEADYARE